MKRNVIVLFLLAAAMLWAKPVSIIDNGASKSVIIVEDMKNPILKMAGEELAMQLKKRTGATVQVLTANAKIPQGRYPIYLGLSARTKNSVLMRKKSNMTDIF